MLFSVADEVYFGLNPVAAEVWELLPPAHLTLDALCDELCARHPEVPAEELRRDVIDLLESLESFGLVVPPPEVAQHAIPRAATVEASVA